MKKNIKHLMAAAALAVAPMYLSCGDESDSSNSGGGSGGSSDLPEEDQQADK